MFCLENLLTNAKDLKQSKILDLLLKRYDEFLALKTQHDNITLEILSVNFLSHDFSFNTRMNKIFLIKQVKEYLDSRGVNIITYKLYENLQHHLRYLKNTDSYLSKQLSGKNVADNLDIMSWLYIQKHLSPRMINTIDLRHNFSNVVKKEMTFGFRLEEKWGDSIICISGESFFDQIRCRYKLKHNVVVNKIFENGNKFLRFSELSLEEMPNYIFKGKEFSVLDWLKYPIETYYLSDMPSLPYTEKEIEKYIYRANNIVN